MKKGTNLNKRQYIKGDLWFKTTVDQEKKTIFIKLRLSICKPESLTFVPASNGEKSDEARVVQLQSREPESVINKSLKGHGNETDFLGVPRRLFIPALQ